MCFVCVFVLRKRPVGSFSHWNLWISNCESFESFIDSKFVFSFLSRDIFFSNSMNNLDLRDFVALAAALIRCDWHLGFSENFSLSSRPPTTLQEFKFSSSHPGERESGAIKTSSERERVELDGRLFTQSRGWMCLFADDFNRKVPVYCWQHFLSLCISLDDTSPPPPPFFSKVHTQFLINPVTST